MSDNTVLNSGTGGDTIRDLDRGSTGIKTQVIQLDLGGAATNSEKLITAGQQTAANSVPVVVASDQGRVGQVQLTGSANTSALGLAAAVTAYGTLMTSAETGSRFTEPFDGASIDTTSRWNSPIVSGMTVTQASGGLTIGTTTVASNSAYIDTQPTFAPVGLNFLGMGWVSKFEAQVSSKFSSNIYRFMGLGDRPATFAYATPVGNAYGFEIDGTGQLNAVVYNNGTNIFKASTSLLGANLNTLISSSGGFNAFNVTLRADMILFYLNTPDVPVAVFNFQSAGFTPTNLQSLPLRFCAINNSVAPAASTFVIAALGVGDSGQNAQAISDGTYQWRVAKVNSGGSLQTSVQAADTSVTAVGAASAAVTLTLPAPGPNLYHYITSIQITKYATAAVSGASTPTTVTTTNLSGSKAYTFGTAAAIGSVEEKLLVFNNPLKSTAANTATTIVCPVTTSIIWRVNVDYYVGT